MYGKARYTLKASGAYALVVRNEVSMRLNSLIKATEIVISAVQLAMFQTLEKIISQKKHLDWPCVQNSNFEWFRVATTDLTG
jgi:hypothetical protein